MRWTGARITRRERGGIARRAKVPSKHGTGMTRNSAAAGLCFPSRRDEMRGNQCAINSPRFTATSSRWPIPLLASSRAFKALLLPARPIPLWTARRLFSSLAKNYFNLLSSSPCPPSPPRRPTSLLPISTSSCSNPTGEWIYSALFRDLFFARSAP